MNWSEGFSTFSCGWDRTEETTPFPCFWGEIPPGRWLSPALQVFFLAPKSNLIYQEKSENQTKTLLSRRVGLEIPEPFVMPSFFTLRSVPKKWLENRFCWFWKHPPEGGITPLLQYLRWRWEIWKTSPATPLTPISNPHKPVNVLRCFQKSVHPEPSSSSSGLTMPRRF